MKKFLMMLWVLSLIGSTSLVRADEMAAKTSDMKAKTVILQGILVDSDCYLKEGVKGDDHDSMKACGKDCLNDGVPAGLLVGDKLYILLFPSKAFASYVGKTLEINGELYGDNIFHPSKAAVVEKSGKKNIKLSGLEMM